MASLFGTDGVRGLANRDVTADLALRVAQAASVVLGAPARHAGRRPVAVLARDPRTSGDFISAAVAAGFASSGVDVYDAGVIPTPAAAYLVADFGADFGCMISASHNPAPDNGIKFFARKGKKLDDDVEEQIEAALGEPFLMPLGSDVGRIRRFADAEDRYVVHLLSTLPHTLEGIHVVLDCAHGAAAGVSPDVFTTAGATVTVMGNDPTGDNINDQVGSTHMQALIDTVLELGADVGIAHDGDADRCLAVDATGSIVDGDQIMAILATALDARGALKDRTLVATVMSNLGLRVAMAERGIRMLETRVGDRYVLEAINAEGYNLGGEQSGHIIFGDYATTGDGILTGLQLVSQMAATGKSLAELASIMKVYPQTLINVRGVDREAVEADEVIAQAVLEAGVELGEMGRVLLRPSGTEPLVRVMVEADEQATADRVAGRLADLVRERLALAPAK
ncbi:phosphoglucosamine mutase [soil metagenome]